jgi:hypothetical protein
MSHPVVLYKLTRCKTAFLGGAKPRDGLSALVLIAWVPGGPDLLWRSPFLYLI